MRTGKAVGTIAVAIVIGSCVDVVAPPDVISAPPDVTVTLVGTSSARITWGAPPESLYVDSYNLLRDGVKIAQTTTRSYQDNNLLQGVTYKYRVSANGQIGIPGELSAETAASAITIPDVTPPTITSSSPAAGATGVASNATVSVTFSEPMDAATINTTTFFLKTSGGALIPGAVAYTAATRVAVFTPTSALPSSTTLTANVTTGAKDVAGNGLAAIFSFSFSTRDEIPPRVVSTSPSNGATGIPVTTAITVTFSEAMNASTVNASSVLLKLTSSSASVAGTVNYNSATLTATLTPSEQLSFGTGYTIIVTIDAKDVAGNSIAAGFSSAFSTASAPDNTPPTVISVSPANGAANVAVLTPITVTFSEPMNPATVNTSTIVLKVTSTSAVVSGAVSYDGSSNTASFSPSAGTLAFGTGYTLSVSGAADVAGNPMSGQFTATFTTVAAPDTTPPTVASSSPSNGATGVALGVAPTVTFSEAMDASTINGSTIILRVTSSGVAVPGSVSYNSGTNTATFTPSSQLSFSTSYTLSVTTGVQDAAGNPMASAFSAAFTTVSNPDTTRPTVIASTRLGASGPPLENRSITAVTFSEPMDASTINGSNITLHDDKQGVFVGGTVTYDAATNTARFTASSPLGYVSSGTGGNYTLTVTTGVTDLAGNNLASNFTASSTRVSYYQGTTEIQDTTKVQIHIHITFAQSGATLGRALECQPLPAADCDLLPVKNANSAVGTLDDQGIAATITALSGTFSNPGITFTFTLANGNTFTFTGTMSNIDTMTGTLSGATLSAPVSLTLAR